MLQRPIDMAKIVTKNEISNKLNVFYLSSTVFHTIHSFYRKIKPTKILNLRQLRLIFTVFRIFATIIKQLAI